MEDLIEIDAVIVNPGRRALRDVSELAKSIAEVGLINPITVTPDNHLVAGYHRLEACRSLGWSEIPACVIDLDEVLRELAEIDENLIRNELTELERAQHLKRRKALYLAAHPETGHGKATVKKDPKLGSFVDDTAKKARVGRTTVSRAVQRAERIAPDVQEEVADTPIADSGVELDALAKLEPEVQREVVRDVKAGKARDVRQAVVKRNRAERIEAIEEKSTAGDGPAADVRYPVILADPPWRYEHVRTENRAIENQYPTMDLDAICALPVPTTEDAILFLWTTSPKLEEGLRVVHEWGFTYRTCMVWVKDKIGMGYYARQQHELLLIATRGKIPPPDESARPPSVISAPRGEHSAKPEIVHQYIERMYPTLPRLEMFCRSPREGWAAWGHES